MRLLVPSASIAAGKAERVSASSAMPSNQKACYGVAITGLGIEGTAPGSCGLTLGIAAGFVEPGSVIEAQVPRGTNRKVELYTYLQAEGQNLPCPTLIANPSMAQLTKIYLVGTAEKVDMSGAETVVEITASFPGSSNHIAQQNAMPTACTTAASSPTPGFRISAGSKLAIEQGQTVSTGYSLMGRVGGPLKPKQLNAADGHKLIVR